MSLFAKKGLRTKQFTTYAFVALGILPAFTVAFILHIYPIFQGIYISLFRWSGLSQRKTFIGLSNYIRLFSDDIVWQALLHDLYIVFFKMLFTMTLALFFSGFLNLSLRKYSKFFQGVFFFPNMLAVPIVAIIFAFVYSPTFGILNSILRALGLEHLTRAWLGDHRTALPAVLFPTIWAAVGYQMLIISAGISTIPESYLEMAILEGVGRIRLFFTIILPLLRNVIKTCLSLMIINTLNETFIFVRVMTRGGPNYGTEVLGTYMYFQAFDNFKFGYGTTVAMMNFLLALVLTVLVTRLMRLREEIEYA